MTADLIDIDTFREQARTWLAANLERREVAVLCQLKSARERAAAEVDRRRRKQRLRPQSCALRDGGERLVEPSTRLAQVDPA